MAYQRSDEENSEVDNQDGGGLTGTESPRDSSCNESGDEDHPSEYAESYDESIPATFPCNCRDVEPSLLRRIARDTNIGAAMVSEFDKIKTLQRVLIGRDNIENGMSYAMLIK